jgi:hypothetical protein
MLHIEEDRMASHSCTSRTTLVLFATLVLSVAPAPGGEPSKLWGERGEHWEADGRLPDFSFAGYRRGEAPIPDVPVAASVRDFGAKGDGTTDDTAAFKKAIERTPRGAIAIPPGRYLITDILEINKPNLVLRGAGPDKTTLVLPKPLNDVKPNMGATTGGRATSNYSWSGGFVWVRGDFRSNELAKITAPAARGDTTLTVSSAKKLKVGQDVEVRQDDEPGNTLAAHLYGGQPGDTGKLNGRTRASLTARVTAINGARITLDRPLRFDVDDRWKPRVLAFDPTVREVGIEGIRFEFPVQPYAGHFTELGHNAITIQAAADCWVRDIAIDHCDSGIFVGGRFCTVDGVAYRSDRSPDKANNTGHHGATLSGDDNLFTRFDLGQRFIHDLTVTSSAAGNVFSAGRGVDLAFDHHKRAPHANLFTNLDTGAGTRVWRSGGGDQLGKHTAAWVTFWNVRAAQPQSWPPERFGPDLMNLVGLPSTQPAVTEPNGKWFEPIDPKELTPSDLHKAQLERRLKRSRPSAGAGE